MTIQILPSDLPPVEEILVRHGRHGDISIRTGAGKGYTYDIEHERIDTPDKLVRWLLHLSTTKIWFTRQHARQLIEAFADITGFRRHGL